MKNSVWNNFFENIVRKGIDMEIFEKKEGLWSVRTTWKKLVQDVEKWRVGFLVYYPWFGSKFTSAPNLDDDVGNKVTKMLVSKVQHLACI